MELKFSLHTFFGFSKRKNRFIGRGEKRGFLGWKAGYNFCSGVLFWLGEVGFLGVKGLPPGGS